jgi:phosphoesterase RecJ-like protein
MNDSKDEVIKKIVGAIHQHQRFLVATHVRPDGDAIGSLMALTFMLRRLGKKADPYCQDEVPPGQEFLLGDQTIRHDDIDPSLYEVAVVVDCGELNRVGSALVESIRQIPLLINIDHHISETPFGDIFWVDPSASSTCELLYDLFSQLQDDYLGPDIASQLYAGVLTDTGSFRFSNTTQRALQMAADLVSAGANPAYIAEQIYDSSSPQGLSLLGKVLSTIAYYDNWRLATAELTQAMFCETGTSSADSEGFINYLRSVKPAKMVMLFREEPDGSVRVSLRSKNEVDVAVFAHRYGGGGHRRAAALHVPGPLESVRPKLTQEAVNHLAKG